MSLMQLLTVGKSLGTVRDQPSRYKMRQQNLLPRFGAAKHVEGSPAPMPQVGTALAHPELNLKHVETEEVGPDQSSSKPAAVDLESDAIQNAARSGRTEKPKVTAEVFEQSQNSAERVSGSGIFRKVASPWRGWPLLRNPFKARSRPADNGGPVQGELILDMIKPVRNDLNDSDLEIIPSRNPPADENKPAEAEAGNTEISGNFLSRLLEMLGFRTR